MATAGAKLVEGHTACQRWSQDLNTEHEFLTAVPDCLFSLPFLLNNVSLMLCLRALLVTRPKGTSKSLTVKLKLKSQPPLTTCSRKKTYI